MFCVVFRSDENLNGAYVMNASANGLYSRTRQFSTPAHPVRFAAPQWIFRFLIVALLMSSLSASADVVTAATPPQHKATVLGIKDGYFTLNGRRTFLLGFSYYGALGAPKRFIRQDLTDLHGCGFNWLRVWATWDAYETNLSAVTAAGTQREPYLTRLKWLVAECNRRGMIVDVTLTRGTVLKGLDGHLKAVATLVNALRPFRNWYLNLGNERNIKDARYVSLAEVRRLRDAVKDLDPKRLVTASFSGRDLKLADVREALEVAKLDFLCPHRPRNEKSPSETEAQTRETLGWMKRLGHVVPLHYQEPFRRGYTTWEPTADDFLKDLHGALRGGAAGWCFHNGGQRSQPNEEPRHSFDLRKKPLMDQLDTEELKVVNSVKKVLRDFPGEE